jgi:hypothetical protein
MDTAVLERPQIDGTLDLSKPLPVATFKMMTSITAGRAIELAAAGQLIPWQGVIAVEGVRTGDRRFIDLGALRWADLPLPLMAQFENPVGGEGHDGAVLAGRIDDIVRIDSDRVWASGVIDPAAPGGLDLVNALDKMLMRGISVDLDDVLVVQRRTEHGMTRGIASGRIRGATVVPFQAIVEASIQLDIESLVASAGDASGSMARLLSPIDGIETFIESHGGLVASGKIPVDPPAAWFEKRKFDGVTPLTYTGNGEVFGHIAAWGTCHISFRRCEPVPRSQTNYSSFRTNSVLTAEGTTVRVGPLIMDTVHPDLRRMAADAQAFYHDTGCVVADVVPYEDKYGIAIVGAVRPDVKPEQLRALRGSDISPDWRTVNGRPRECVAMLAVNNSGFKVPQSLVASAGQYVEPGKIAAAIDTDGEVLALVASGPMVPEDLGAEVDEKPDVTDEWRDQARARVMERFGPKFRTFTEAAQPRVRILRAATAPKTRKFTAAGEPDTSA